MESCCFCGFKQLNLKETSKIEDKLRIIICSLIEKGVNTFLFGLGGRLEHIAWGIVTSLKIGGRYSNLERVLYLNTKDYALFESYDLLAHKYSVEHKTEVDAFEKVLEYEPDLENMEYSELENVAFMLCKADVYVCYLDTSKTIRDIDIDNFETREIGEYANYLNAKKLNKRIINLFYYY